MMSKKLRFMWQNWFDEAVVTASSEAADYPVENLQNRWATWEWRSTGLAGEWVIADLGGAGAVQALVVEGMNFTAGATVELGGHAADPTGMAHTTYELMIPITAAMVLASRIVVLLPAAETYQWWRLLITDAGNPDAYLSASRLYLGPVFSAAYHYKEGSGRKRESQSSVNLSGGGQTSAAKRPKWMTHSLQITMLGQSDVNGFDEMDEECGIDTPLWVCLDSTDPVGSAIYVALMEQIDLPTKTSLIPFTTTIKLKQEL